MGPVPPSLAHAKEEPPSPVHVRVKRELASPLRRLKDEPASRPHNRGLHFGGRIKGEPASPQRIRRVKHEPVSPSPHSTYARIDGIASLPCRNYRPVKE